MSEATPVYIGRKLQAARLSKGLTQAEVAKRAGTNTNYYAKLERGLAIPSLKKLEKIIKVLETKSSEILPF